MRISREFYETVHKDFTSCFSRGYNETFYESCYNAVITNFTRAICYNAVITNRGYNAVITWL